MTSYHFTFFIPLESPDGGIYFYRTKVRNGEETLQNVSPDTFSKFLVAFTASMCEVLDFHLSQTDKNHSLLRPIESLDDLETIFESNHDVYFCMTSELGNIQVEVEYMNQLAKIRSDSEVLEDTVIESLRESGATQKPFGTINEFLKSMIPRGIFIPAHELGKDTTEAIIKERVKETDALGEIRNPFTAILESCDEDQIDFFTIALHIDQVSIKVGEDVLNFAPSRHTVFEIQRLRSGLIHLLRGIGFPTKSFNEELFGPEFTQNLGFSFEIGRPAESIKPSFQLLVSQVNSIRLGRTFAATAMFGGSFHSCQVTHVELLDFIKDLRVLERSLVHLLQL